MPKTTKKISLENQVSQMQEEWFDLCHSLRHDVHALMDIDYDSSTLRQRVKVKAMELQRLDEDIYTKMAKLETKSNKNGKCY